MEYGNPRTIVTPAGTLTFNDFSSPSYYRITSIEGADGGDVRSSIDRIPQRDGAVVRDAYESEMTEVWTGMIVTTDLTVRTQMEDKLRSYLKSMMRANGLMTWTPTGYGDRQRTVRLKERLMIRGGLMKEFQFALVAADPLAYATTEQTHDSSPVVTGGEFGPAPFMWYVTATSGGDALVANGGMAATFPRVRLYGPWTSAVILNVSTGKQISLQSLPVGLIAAGHYAEIDMRNETIYKDGNPALPLLQYMDNATSEFWSLRPGVTDTLDFQAVGGVTVATLARIYWRDAWD